ncbi:CBS domain-containing protein [Lentzea sp. BCCO 10_0798]|uniref:CBS domain-containing protein n=1 Tax=Lentzea kristufekii TaxID=3095430 RepID=A0ABU4TYU2_9PSEU|nr:CBS domain-containing protein [Lentzea sp. BCCO 10_0798]MDX8053484.1 CBS domain-containing protein [Lentzea sp. BCCO 10_0798]
MDSGELLTRLHDGGFRRLPLIDEEGQVVGMHLTRFLRGGYLDVVQVRWSDGIAVWSRLLDELNTDASSGGPQRLGGMSGPFFKVAAALMPNGGRHIARDPD